MSTEVNVRILSEKGLCAQPENKDLVDNFFSANPEKKYEAKNLCFKCPVRGDCIKWALEEKEINGIWGGRDENEIRRTLSVNAEGNEVRRGRYPQCGYCGARTRKLKTKVIDLPNGGRWTTARVVECTECGFEWRSRSSANAVDAYFAEREAVAARNAKRREIIMERNAKEKEREKERAAKEKAKKKRTPSQESSSSAAKPLE